MKRVFLLLLFGFLICVFKTFGQNISNEGTDFWTVFPTHVNSAVAGDKRLANIVVYITSQFVSEVTVSCGTYAQTLRIPANTAVPFAVSRFNAYVDKEQQNTVLTDKGIHIVVTPGMPKVSAYAHIYAGARSAATLILPKESLGQTYYSMNFTQSEGGDNFLAVVAVEDDTHLLLTQKGGSQLRITLPKAGDVYEYIAGDRADLTGVSVTVDPTTSSSCKKFAAFSGSSSLFLGFCETKMNSLDPLYQQLYPPASWGKNYGIVPFKDRKYILRIVAQDNGTQVTVGGQVQTLSKGDFIETPELTQSMLVSANKLISVAQYSLSQDCSSATNATAVGDPDMVILNPIEFNIQNITVFSSDKQDIIEKYINILIKASKTESFKINGVKPNIVWQSLIGDPSFAFAQIEVYEQSLTLTADDGFNAIAYGFGNYESYAYSAGTNLASNNYLSVVNTATGDVNPDGCVGAESQLNISLPYKAQSIKWYLDGIPSSTQPAPELVKTVTNATGDPSYIYKSPYMQTFTEAAKHTLRADVVVESAGTCLIGNFTTNYIFNIYNLPTAEFTSDLTGCANANVQFSDKSVSNNDGFNITEWKWDFGDESDPSNPESSEQNPQHKFLKEGIYTIKQSVKSNTGCFSNEQAHEVTVFPLPIADFMVLEKSCIDVAVLFTDKSTISLKVPTSSISKWHWDFGDGVSEDYTNGDSFAHKFAKVGIYTVKLTLTSNKGCLSEVFSKTITIVDIPFVDFILPDYCINDGVAVFKNLSKNTDGTENGLNYDWKFVGGNVTGTSNIKDGEYKFPAPGDYLITLTTSNGLGCENSSTKPFTVNSEVKKADFTVQNMGNVCSGKDVIINNTSRISIGKIVKIKIYKDFEHVKTDPITILSPGSEDIHLSYPSFGGDIQKPYQIKLVAYSGQNCSEAELKTIMLNPSPQLAFNQIPKICTDEGMVLINQARETSGLSGEGFYSGSGIDADGNFNSKTVGPGQHLITYTFNAKNGCTESIQQTVNVFASPSIILAPKIFVLSGGQIKVAASAIGDQLTYKWFPSTFLDHDDVLNPIATPSSDIEYTLVVSTADGCASSAKVFVKVLEKLEVANAFSPNGDGVNDVWTIKYLDSYPNATVEVFNRDGSRVFFSQDYNKPFDGTFRGSPLPVGVYYFIINPKNGRKLVTGPLTIIK
ncbi:gliding motility-associated-like protein [Pedobacter sp. UYEF25]